jgi:hypothetical protein
MALTLEAEQRMRDVGAIAFYEEDAEAWFGTVRDTKAFLEAKFPPGSPIRRDDVAKALVPILEVHEGFKDFRNEQKLRPKYWVRDYADLLIDRAWDRILEEAENA